MEAKNESANEAAAKLAALINGGERVYTPDTAPEGYAPLEAVIEQLGGSASRRCSIDALTALEVAGQVESVWVRVGKARRQKWWKPK